LTRSKGDSPGSIGRPSPLAALVARIEKRLDRIEQKLDRMA
jgi:hypothetical protein